jgi:hypothetical protein
MPKSQETLNTELDDLISSHGFDVIAMDSSGKEVPVPDEAELFQFHFHRNGQDLGTVTCTIDGNKDMAVYYDDKITKLGEGDSVGSEISWLELVKQLKRFALNRQLTFKLKDTDRLRTDMKRRAHIQKQETSLYEGWSGNKHTSYNDANKSVKIVVKHNKKLEENDARFRYIDKIFLETAQGERLLVPTTKPSQARMFARHIAEGGDYRDERWEHINEVCQDVNQLAKFVRATKDKKEQFNESAGRMIDEAISKYAELKKLAESLQTSRGYNKYFESYSPSMIIESDDEILEAFTTNSLDSRIKESAGVLAKYGIKYNKIKESSSFERWADDIIGEALDLDNNDPKMAISK